MMDFTIQQFHKICTELKKYNFIFITFSEYFDLKQSNCLPKKFVIFRHDIDRFNINALKIAELENNIKINATYYFRDRDCSFSDKVIAKIASLGHEIGYHYEVLSDCHGDYHQAIKLFKINLIKFRNIYNVQTICMHGSPLSKFDNRDLWKKFSFNDFDIKGEAYLSVDYSNIIYLTDTGRCWDGYTKNIRDYVETNHFKNIYFLHSSNDLIRFIGKSNQPLVIQTHPERWAYNLTTFIRSFIFDIFSNMIKFVIKRIR